jgi:Transcriptional regulators
LTRTILPERREAETLALFLFAHLALASDADKGLAEEQLNRTHHRILFLVDCRPGVTVSELVNLLRVTPQAINSPLRTLIDHGLIRQKESATDRRKRDLFLTEEGEALLATVTEVQFRRISAVFDLADAKVTEGFLSVLRGLMDEADRNWLFPNKKAAKRRPRTVAA